MMPRIARFLLGLFVVVFAVLLALQAFLSCGLTRLVQQKILPAARAALGADIRLRSVAANLFRRSGSVTGVTVPSPAGFDDPLFMSVDTAYARFRLPPLWHRTADLQELRISGARLTISRNTAGILNLDTLTRPRSGETALPVQATTSNVLSSQITPGPAPAAPTAVRANTPRVLLERLRADGVVEFLNYQGRPVPARLGLDLRCDARNVKTYAEPGDEWAPFKIEGNLDTDPRSCVIKASGKLAPLLDPARPSFDLTGEIGNIDVKRLETLFTNLAATADAAAVSMRLVCRDGVFDPNNSVITATLKKVSLTGREFRSLKGPAFAELKIILPVNGPLMAPEVDAVAAMTRAALEQLSRDPDAASRLLDLGKDLLSRP